MDNAFSLTASQGHLIVEAGRLLDDVRCALKSDIVLATTTATRLAELLVSETQNEIQTPIARGGLAPWQVRKVKKHIDEKLDAPLPVEALAKMASLSTNHFSRAFKESFGEPPHAFIIKKRVERAAVMMLTTLERIADIALACGFADQAHLCHSFRRAMEMSPAAWRRRHSAAATQATLSGPDEL